MNAVAPEAARVGGSSVQQNLCAKAMGERDEPLRERIAARDRPVPFAQLDHPEPVRERSFRACQEDILAEIIRTRDAVHWRQRQRGENCVYGQQRSDGVVPRQRHAKPARRPHQLPSHANTR